VRAELVLNAVEAQHHDVKLLVLLRLLFFFSAVEHEELALELCLDTLHVRTLLHLLLSIHLEEVGKLGALLALADINDDTHDDVLEEVFAVSHLVCDLDLLG